VAGTPATSDGRRTNTRARIQDVALDVFSERGYERASLREIAERLEITRPALYYHFTSKEDILASIHAELAESIDDVVDWARARPDGRDMRRGVLSKLAALLTGPWGRFTQFAQANEAAMRSLTGATEFIERIDAIAEILAPSQTVEGRIRGRLAISALFMGSARNRQIGGNQAERAAVSLAIATELVG
jgi:AcrR family transcriptional regulator